MTVQYFQSLLPETDNFTKYYNISYKNKHGMCLAKLSSSSDSGTPATQPPTQSYTQLLQPIPGDVDNVRKNEKFGTIQTFLSTNPS